MALADFIQSLQDDDIVYSEAPAPSIQVIPPEASIDEKPQKKEGLKVSPPELEEVKETKNIKLKLNNTPTRELPKQTQPTLKTNTTQQKIETEKDIASEPTENSTIQTANQNIQNNQQEVVSETDTTIPDDMVKPTPIVEETTPSAILEENKPNMAEIQENKIDILFNKSGTEISKKPIWLKYYEKAQKSRKHNQVAERMKAGKFTITPDDKVLILPDYDTVNKDPDDIIKDTWL